MQPLVLTHPACRLHQPGAGHPETPARLDAALRGTRGAQVETTPVRAERVHLVAAHAAGWVDAMLAAEGRPFAVDGETLGSAESVDAALWAAGAVLDGVRRLLAGSARRVLAWVRPPGHHAEHGQGMGFCFFNNVAVGVREALYLGAERVAVVDVDVHFGNGTQHIFRADPRVLVIDVHEDNLYPTGGGVESRGVGAGRGFTINVPLRPTRARAASSAASDDADYLRILDGLVAPALRRFRPDLLVVSLGFDAHTLDPLAHMRLSSAGYGLILARLAAVAEQLCGGRLLVVLEGGYDLGAIEASSQAVVDALTAENWPDALEVTASPSWTEALAALDEALDQPPAT